MSLPNALGNWNFQKSFMTQRLPLCVNIHLTCKSLCYHHPHYSHLMTRHFTHSVTNWNNQPARWLVYPFYSNKKTASIVSKDQSQDLNPCLPREFLSAYSFHFHVFHNSYIYLTRLEKWWIPSDATQVCLIPTNTTTTSHSLLTFKRWLDKKLKIVEVQMPSLMSPPHPLQVAVPKIYLASKSLCETDMKFWVDPGLPGNPRRWFKEVLVSLTLLTEGSIVLVLWSIFTALTDSSRVLIHWYLILKRRSTVLIRFWKVSNSLKATSILEDGRKHRR